MESSRSIVVLYLVLGLISAQNALFSQPVMGISSATSYYVAIVLGSNNANTFSLLLDTGSSNDAVAGQGCCAAKPNTKTFSCAASQTCTRSNQQVRVNYASASIQGTLVQETFSTTQLGAIRGVDIIQISAEQGFIQRTFNGILGVGYESLAQPRAAPASSLYREIINRGANDVFGLLLCGTLQTLLQNQDSTNYHAGQWVIGGIDGTRGEKYYKGELMYTPIVKEQWYVVLVTDMGMGSTSFKIPCDVLNSPQAIIDSGTTNLVLPSSIYAFVVAQIKREVLRVEPNFAPNLFSDSVPCCSQSYCNPNQRTSILNANALYFTFAFENSGDTSSFFSITIPPEHFFRPTVVGSQQCRVFGISEGDHLVLGNVFMDGLYTVHDRKSKKIGFGIASNCPNRVQSSKKISQVSESSNSWCTCLSSSLQSDSEVVSFLPGRGRCFFIQWWMYGVIVGVTIIVLCAIVVCCTCCQRRKKAFQPRRSRTGHYGNQRVVNTSGAYGGGLQSTVRRQPQTHSRNPTRGRIDRRGAPSGTNALPYARMQ